MPFRALAIAVLATILLGQSAHALDLYWDTATTAGLQAGDGNWSTSGGGSNVRWSSSTAGSNPLLNWTNGNDAIFEASGTSTVTLSGSVGITVNSMTFNGTGYTIAGTGSPTFTLVGSNITTNQNATISAIMGGSVGLTKLGTATLTLSGTAANIYTGTTTVNAGELDLNKTAGVNAIAGNLTIGDGTGTDTVKLLASNQIANTGAINVNGANAIFDIGAFNDTVGGVTLTNGSITGTTGVLTGSSYAVENGSISAILGGSGVTLTKTTSGTVTLSGANTYTGSTTVSAGTLFVNGNQSAATGTVTVTNSGTLLGGAGTIGGAVSIGATSTIAPGATGNGSTAILRTGNLTLASTSNFSLDLNGATAGSTYDQLSVTGSVSIGGSTLVFNSISGLSMGDELFIVVNDGMDLVSGTFSNGMTFSSGGYEFEVNYAANSGDGFANDISLTVVPEPSTWAAGALTLAAIAFRQRRRLRKLIKRAA